MHDPKLIETMRWHLACYFSQNRMPHMSGDPQARLLPHQKRDLHDAVDAALTALCTARPDVAAVLRGEAVVVPREATRIMLNRGMEAYIKWSEAIESQCLDEKEVAGIYRDMLAASPLAQEPNDAG